MFRPFSRLNARRSSLSVGKTPDTATLLTVYVVLLLAIPSDLTVQALASAGSPALIWGLGATVLWLVYQAQRTRSMPPTTRAVSVSAFVFLAAALVSYVSAMTSPLPVDEVSVADTGLIRIISWVGILILANDGITTLPRLVTLLRRLVLGVSIVAALGIFQFATRLPVVDLITIPGLTAGETGLGIRGGLVRAAGTAIHPLEYAMVLAMTLPIAVTLALNERGRSWVVRWLPPMVIVVGLSLAGSRSAVVGIAAGLIILVPTLSGTLRWRLAGAAFAIVALIYVVSPRVVTNMRYMFLSVLDDPSAISRTDSLDLFNQVFIVSPLFGRGFGTFLPQYRILDNQYLLLLIEIGVLGIVAFAALAAASFASALSGVRRQTGSMEHNLGFALSGSVFAGIVLLALFDALSFPQSAGLLFLMFGLCGAYGRINRSNRDASPLGANLHTELTHR